MLNRRTLRIKVMQSLFAFDQCKEADYQLAIQFLEERFQPDLNSMEVQDKEGLRRQKKTARQLFEKKFKNPDSAAEADDNVMKAVDQALKTYQQQVKKDLEFFSRNMLVEIERLTTQYLLLLSLVLEFAQLAKTEKKVDHSNFFENAWVNALNKNEELKSLLLRSNADWSQQSDRVRGWFRDVVKADPVYQDYIAERKPDEDGQKNFVKHLVRKSILGEGAINDFFEELDIRWAEDKQIIRSLVDKTIKSYKDGKVELQKISLDWDDDKVFIDKLMKSTVSLDSRFKQLIAKNTKNWEVDRLPLTDRIIIEMAIAEMIHFPNIPVKVTINEYIELAKEYSTPKSRQFINGILDVLSKILHEAGDIKKSGRGLIDNK
jgi:transcription antitermination protein NusB